MIIKESPGPGRPIRSLADETARGADFGITAREAGDFFGLIAAGLINRGDCRPGYSSAKTQSRPIRAGCFDKLGAKSGRTPGRAESGKTARLIP